MNPGVKRREPRTPREEGGVLKVEDGGWREKAGAEMCGMCGEMLAPIVLYLLSLLGLEAATYRNV